MNLGVPLEPLNEVALAEVVRAATERPGAQLGSWMSQPLGGGGGNAALYRVAGEAEDNGQAVSWAVVAKIAMRPAVETAATAWNYWRRESLAYASGFLDDLAGIRTPRCFGVREQADSNCIWLEDVAEHAEEHWSPARYELAARHLGQMSGSLALQPEEWSYPWLSVSWLRSWLGDAAAGVDLLDAARTIPLVRSLYPTPQLRRVEALWDERDRMLDVLDVLPRTLCHFDAFRRNLFALPGGTTMLADWAYVGLGPVGADLGPFVCASVLLGGVDIDALPDLEQAALRGYARGLRDVSFQFDANALRLAYLLSAALRYTFYGAARLDAVMDESRHVWVERVVGRPIADYVAHVAQVMGAVLDRADEARVLLRGAG